MGDHHGHGDGSDGDGGDADDVHLDLDELACPTCRRDLLPWQTECPDCREPAVLRFGLAPAVPPPPAHLLDDDTRRVGAVDDGADAAAGELIARALVETREETREPTDDVDGPPQPPPVGGDPFVG